MLLTYLRRKLVIQHIQNLLLPWCKEGVRILAEKGLSNGPSVPEIGSFA